LNKAEKFLIIKLLVKKGHALTKISYFIPILIIIFITDIFPQEFRNLMSPRQKYLYEYREIYLSKLRDSLNTEINGMEVDKKDIEELTKNLYYKTLHYNCYKYRLTDILDTMGTLDFIRTELSGNDYFKKRLEKWPDHTVLEYVTFSIELNILKRYLSEFRLEDFKRTDIYKTIVERLGKDSINSASIDSVFIRIKKLGFEPLHFYYRPNSIEEQYKADKFDLKKFNFSEMVKFVNDHREVLEMAESEYNVNKEIIVAVLRKETDLGRYPLKYNPFEVLLSQSLFAIENPASDTSDRTNNLKRISRLKDSAMNSLCNILKYTIENSLDPSETKSNFVGAVGFTQFMPFNLHLARDGDGDGHADLMNMDDAIMSIANFLNYNGWNKYYELKKSNKNKIVRHILRYNSSDSYCEAVYEIAAELHRQISK